MIRFTGVVRFAFALELFLVLPFAGQEWIRYRPSLQSEVIRVPTSQLDALLSQFCFAFERTERVGYTCRTRLKGTAFEDIEDGKFHPEGVIFGNFVEPQGQDAAISGWSAESHPYHWGGTLLLSKRNKKWIPVWYKSGLITRSCEKAERPDGREILLCELEDGGMGHRYHSLFAVDLRQPSVRVPIAQADSFESDFCTGQQQVLDAVTWEADRNSFSVVLRTPHWQRLPSGTCGPHPPTRPSASVRFLYEVTSKGVRPKSSR